MHGLANFLLLMALLMVLNTYVLKDLIHSFQKAAGRRIERLPRFLARHLRRRDAAQLVVDQRQQLRRGVGIAGFDSVQDLGDIGHPKLA